MTDDTTYAAAWRAGCHDDDFGDAAAIAAIPTPDLLRLLAERQDVPKAADAALVEALAKAHCRSEGESNWCIAEGRRICTACDARAHHMFSALAPLIAAREAAAEAAQRERDAGVAEAPWRHCPNAIMPPDTCDRIAAAIRAGEADG